MRASLAKIRLDNREIIQAKMTQFLYSAAARYSTAWSVRNAPRLGHDSADSHPSHEMNAGTVTGPDAQRQSCRGREGCG